MRRSGLGKGLGALIPTNPTSPTEGDATSGPSLVEIAVTEVRPNPNQPRRVFDEAGLDALAASIRELGVLQPVLVRTIEGADGYELIAGERRFRAARRAGLATVPAIIRTTDDLGSVEQALVENLHREDLNPLEEAAAYQQLIDEFSLTHERLAERVGKSRVSITNSLRLLQLPPPVQKLVREEKLSAGHARALLGIDDAKTQEKLAQAVISQHWSVRTLEDAVKGDLDQTNPEIDLRDQASKSKPLREPGLLEVESLLSEILATRVTIQMGNRRGKVVVEFADLNDLERIYRVMSSANQASSSTS